MSGLTVFVCGATGCQGGAVARYLRSKDVEVHALVRDPTSKKAHDLESIGVKLTPGDYDNKEAIGAAMAGCTSIFLVLMPDFTDLTKERTWAKNIYSAGKASGVKHAVFSSGFSANEPDKLAALKPGSFVDTVMRNKQVIEIETRTAGFEYWTVLRPGGSLDDGTTPATVLPKVDTVTIGRFGGEALLNPERFHEKEILYADEWLTPDEVMEKLSKAVGRELKTNYLTDEEIDAQKDINPFITGQLIMRDMGKLTSLEEVKKWGIPLSSFDEFLEREKEAVRETYHKSS
ncbi:hypothetical protein NW754_015803 [Fusarium falciforme]|nr:hypothetical protein NW754_015803 [Fusarium falciforme]